MCFVCIAKVQKFLEYAIGLGEKNSAKCWFFSVRIERIFGIYKCERVENSSPFKKSQTFSVIIMMFIGIIVCERVEINNPSRKAKISVIMVTIISIYIKQCFK